MNGLHIFAIGLLALIQQNSADVSLPTIFGNHMVLQQEMAIPVWGWATPGEEVTVKLDDNHASTKADEAGNWKVSLKPIKADGKPHKLTVSGTNEIVYNDILIGEVWLGSGQSNMQWALTNTTGGKEASAAADIPNIRLYYVPRVRAKAPAKDIKANWTVCTPKTAGGFSAVLFHFGHRLQKDLTVPIGLIHSSWGGSPIEPWIPAENGGNASMYNAMIAPVHPFPVRGVIWYQGESNVLGKNGMTYFDKKKALIESWRKAWGHDFSFYFVQIAPWSGRYEPGELPALWEAQSATMNLPKTGMAVITDLVDNIADIHPRNKIPVGNRLALWALAKDYQKDVVYSGPHFQSIKVEGDSVRVNFSHTHGGLKSRDDKPINEFELAGEDGNFVAAEATIDGESVVLKAEGLTAPTQVRFGWRKIANPNLINGHGLPASPFRSKDWKGWVKQQ